MLAGAISIAGVITLLAWRHRTRDLPCLKRQPCSLAERND